MKRTQLTRVTLALVLLLAAATIPAQSAAAQEDESFFDGVVGAADPEGGLNFTAMYETASAYLGGAKDNLAYRLSQSDPERTADDCAADIQATYNQHNASFEAYLNERTEADTSRDVIRIQCTQEVRDGFSTTTERESVYLVGDVVTNNTTNVTTYENTRIVADVDRPVDHRVILSGLATEQGADDLEAFAEEYAEPNETPPRSYAQRMKGKYGGYIHGTFDFLPDPEERV